MMAAILGTVLTLGAFSTPHYSMVPKTLRANLEFRREMLMVAGSDAGAAAQLRKMCSEDLLFYANVFGWTYDPRIQPTVIPFITYAFQDEAMLQVGDCILSGDDYVITKSRDMGASWICLTVFEWFWHFRDNLSFGLVSRKEEYVDEKGFDKSLFWKIDFLHKHQPKWLLPTDRWLGWDDPNRKLLHILNADNGSTINGESTTGDIFRGGRLTSLLVDEHAAFEINDGFRALKATRDVTRSRGFNSTPQGANNAFYEVANNTASRVIRLHWSKHPEKNKGLYKRGKSGAVELLDEFKGLVKVRTKGENETKLLLFPDSYPFKLDGKLRSPWYDSECARCVSEAEIGQELDIDFIGSDYQFFDPETIEVLRKKHCRDALLVGDLEYDPETLEPKRFTENAKGNLTLWLTLDGSGRVAPDRQFATGSDISAGTGASNSVSCVVDKATGEKVGALRSPHLQPNTFADYCIALAKFFNGAFMIWDASGPTGKTFTMRVIKQGYGNIYYRKQDKKVGQQTTDEPGYYLNPVARDSVLGDYRDALGSSKYINRSDPGMKECLQFIRLKDGSIEHSAAANSTDPSGARAAHGDEVIADALACLGFFEQAITPKTPEAELPVNCLAYRMKQRQRADAEKGRDSLGAGWGA